MAANNIGRRAVQHAITLDDFDHARRAKTLKRARTNMMLSLRDVAQRTEMSKSTICSSENPNASPSTLTLSILAEFYEIPHGDRKLLSPYL